jgi:ectoine hydroxylase-related dioxygenase (phytanoyl-CoA dioxygenase family)
MKPHNIEQLANDGFTVIRGVFSPDEVAELAAAFDRIHDEGMRLRSSFRHKNVFFQQAPDANLGKILRMVQWPSYIDTALDRFRQDERLHRLLEPITGANVKQIINQMHWKPPGAAQTAFGYHQDIWFRRPRTAYRDPETAYVQTGLAIDRHGAENGPLMFYPGSHRLGELTLPDDRRVMDRPLSDDGLKAFGLDPANAVPLLMEPGDLGLWNLYTLHGSATNRSRQDRRLYINGYVQANKCDRGEWTFRNGRPCKLGEPVLVHYEDLYTRPEPHYVGER